MEKKDLQKLLSQPYKQANWKQIVQFVFPNVSILSSPKEFPINNEKIKNASRTGITLYKTSDGIKVVKKRTLLKFKFPHNNFKKSSRK